MPIEEKNEKEVVLTVVRNAVQKDAELREKYLIGEKFRFIRDRLQALQTRIEESLSQIQKKEEKRSDQILEDETVVYVYLFNSQGMNIKTWEKMLNPSVFYEYSINRPVYSDKSHIEAYIRSKSNKSQHGYIEFVIKKSELIPGSEQTKDALGHTLIKVKEGSLKADRVRTFIHTEQAYLLNEEGQIVKKTN